MLWKLRSLEGFDDVNDGLSPSNLRIFFVFTFSSMFIFAFEDLPILPLDESLVVLELVTSPGTIILEIDGVSVK